MEFLGVPMYVWHSLVVEEHTGIIVFIIAALAVRVLADIIWRGAPESERLKSIHVGSDVIAYAGSFAAVVFLVLSGITGFLIQPYSTLVSEPILINKALLALGSLFFWTMFFFLRYWFGPRLWERRGLYITEVLTAIIGLIFTALTASVGAELSLGQSAFEPFYQAIGFSWRTFTIQPVDIAITGVVIVVGILLALILTPAPAQQKKTQ